MKNKEKSDTWFALELLGQLGYIIAIPLVILALAGRFFDKKYNTSPWFLIAGMFFALIISTVWVYKKTLMIMNDATENKKDKDEVDGLIPKI